MQGMENRTKLFLAIFTTRTLLQIVCVLGAAVTMKWLGSYYDFNWAIALAMATVSPGESRRPPGLAVPISGV